MSIDFDEPRTHADLWNRSSTWDRAVATVRSNRLAELSSLGVDVSNPAHMRAAYDDHDTMCLLAGREMRNAMALVGPDETRDRTELAAAFSFAEALHDARIAAGQSPRHPREMLL